MVGSARVSGIENELFWLLRVERKIDLLLHLLLRLSLSVPVIRMYIPVQWNYSFNNIPSLNMIESLAGIQRAMQ